MSEESRSRAEYYRIFISIFITAMLEQIVVSTSFGLIDANKVYVSLDLAAKYRNVHDLRIGKELLPMYPDKAPARLGGKAKAS